MAPSSPKSRMIILYSLIEQVESKLQQLPLVLFLLRFYEFLLLIYLILRNSIINKDLNVSNIFNPGFTNVDYYLNYQQVSQTILLAAGIVTLTFFVLISFTQIKSRRFEKDFLIWICLFIVLFMRIVYIFVINQIANAFLKPTQFSNLGDYRYILAVPILIFVVYTTLVNRNNYIFSFLHPIVFAVHNFDKTGYALFCIVLLRFVYQNIYDKQNQKNSYISTLVVAIVFYLLEEIKNDLQYVEFCFLFFFLLMCLMHKFWQPLRITIFSEKKNNTRKIAQFDKKQLLDQYFIYIKNKKESAMKIEHQLLIQSIILDEYEQCHQNSMDRLKPFTTGTKVVDWNTHGHLKFLISQAELYHADGKSKSSKIMLFQFRLEDLGLHYESLLQISEHFYKESIFAVEKYSLYKLMIRLEKWFKKFKTESTFIYNSIQVDNMVLKFYQTLDKLLKLFLEIWDAIKKSVVDFSFIQPLYIQAISQYTFLQKSLINIRKRVKSTTQTDRFNQLSDLLQLKVLSKEDIKHSSFMDDQREQQIPFLRISNRKIIYSSYKFNARFHYTNDQIIGINVDELLPESFRESFISNDQELEEGVHLKLKQFHSILLNGKGCLEFVKISPYIELDFFGQITYMVFFNIETTPASSFILYSLDTDIIEQLSNGFLDIFNLQCKDVHNTVTGKEAFQQFDFSSTKNRQELSVEGDSVQTNISIFQFKSTIADRFNKVGVTVKVVYRFDLNGSIRLLLEIKLLTSDFYKSAIPGIALFVEGLIPNGNGRTNSIPILESRQSVLTDQSSQNKRFMTDLIQKKQTFNRNKSKNSFTANHWKSILRGCLFIVAMIIISVIFYYGSEWYNYMMLQIWQLNQKTTNLVSVFENQFILGMLKKWPGQLTQSDRNMYINMYYGILTDSIQNLYFSVIRTLKDFTMPMMAKFNGGANSGIHIGETHTNLLDIISKSYLIYTENFVDQMIEYYPMVNNLLNEAPNIEDNFYIFRTWMDVCLIICIITLIIVVLLRMYQIYEEKILEKILEDIEMLFSFLKDQEINVCTSAIEKTIEQFQIVTEDVKSGKKPKSKKNKIQKKLKSLKSYQEQNQPFIQKKTSKTSGSSAKAYFKSLIYAIIMIGFFSFLIIYILDVKRQMPNIITYQNEIQLAFLKTQTNLVSSYYYMINQKLGNNITLQLNNLFSTTLIKNDFLIPEQFKQFYGQIWHILNANICYLSEPAELKRCQASILSKGLINTIALNYNNLMKLSLRGLDLMISDGLYDQIIFLRKYVIKQMTTVLNLYFQEMHNYLSYRHSMYYIILIFAVIISLVTTVLIWLDYKDELNKNSICKSLFNIFPESFFLKPQIRRYLEDINLIQRISQF